jgi:predicted nucleotidyltransferase
MVLKSLIVWSIIRIRPKFLLKPFELFYHLALRSTLVSLKKYKKIKAVYICGSMAQGAIFPSMSDIDLKIFFSGKKDTEVFDKIIKTFSRLRLFFPMISIPDEIGIYFLEDFDREYKFYPLLKHLFDHRFHPRKLVWGEDVLAGINLIPTANDDFYSACLWRFKYWFEKITSLYSTKYLNQDQKRYIFYKAVADISLVYLIMTDSYYSYSNRIQILTDIKKAIPDEENATLDKLIKERNALFTKGLFSLNEAFLAFKKLVALCCEKIESLSEQDVVKWPVEFSETEIKGDQKIIGRIQDVLGLKVEVLVIPSCYQATSPLDYESFHLPTYLLLPKQQFHLEQFDVLRTLYRKDLSDKINLFIKENDHYIYSVYSYFMDHFIQARYSDQITFDLLKPSSGMSENNMLFKGFYLKLLKKKLFFYIEQLEEIAGSKGIFKMEPDSFSKFFFSSLSKLILFRSITMNNFHFFTDPVAMADYLISNLAISKKFVQKMVENSEQESFFEQSAKFLELFCQVSKNKKNLDELISLSQTESRKKMIVSVVIATRSHVEQLKRCLISLAQLNRLPDEVLVVDNESQDATKEMVLQFEAPYQLRYVYYSGFGIGKVRNAGIKEANGDVLVFVDDDAVVDQDWLGNLEKEFIKNPYLGICGGSIRNMPMERKDLVYRYFSMMDIM